MSNIVFYSDVRSKKPILITSSNNAGQSFLRRNFIPFNDGTVPGQILRCRAKGCKLNHDSHVCRKCGMMNSNHRTSDCTKKSCKAKGCQENHSIHKCRICGMIDSDHRSSNCLLNAKQTPRQSQPRGHLMVGQSPQGHLVVGHQPRSHLVVGQSPQGHLVVGHQPGPFVVGQSPQGHLVVGHQPPRSHFIVGHQPHGQVFMINR
jgi:hypothetical protein